MKSLLCWIAVLLLGIAAVSCAPSQANAFAVYLLARDIPPAQLLTADLRKVELQPTPILNVGDIISYQRATHTLELTVDAYARVQKIFPMPVRVEGIPFVVRVGSELIYAGAFWTPASSLTFDGPYIMQPFASDTHTIQIELGYPSNAVYTGRDPRADPRIINALQAAGKLKE